MLEKHCNTAANLYSFFHYFFSRNDTCNPFTPEHIDASSYTHIVYSFAAISDSGTLEAWDFEEDIKGGLYQDFLAVKDRYPDVKLILAVGGWTHNDPDNERLYRFSNTASTATGRMKFAQSSVAFLRKYGFDGLVSISVLIRNACIHSDCLSSFFNCFCLQDLDWEYPGDETRGGNATLDRDNYVLLCNELRQYFDEAPEKYELSVAIPASLWYLEMGGFDLENLAKSADYFNGKCTPVNLDTVFDVINLTCSSIIMIPYSSHGLRPPRCMGRSSDCGSSQRHRVDQQCYRIYADQSKRSCFATSVRNASLRSFLHNGQ